MAADRAQVPSVRFFWWPRWSSAIIEWSARQHQIRKPKTHSGTMNRANRPVTRAAIVAVVLLALISCSAPAPLPEQTSQSLPHDADTGQTISEAREAIDAIPGISVTNFAGGEPPNVKGNTGYIVGFAIEPGYTLAHGDLLVDYIIRNVWAVGEGYMPNTQIQISASTADGEPFFDLAAAAEGSTWRSPKTSSAPSQHSSVIFPLSADDPRGAVNLMMLQEDGSWPGLKPKPLPDRITCLENAPAAVGVSNGSCCPSSAASRSRHRCP